MTSVIWSGFCLLLLCKVIAAHNQHFNDKAHNNSIREVYLHQRHKSLGVSFRHNIIRRNIADLTCSSSGVIFNKHGLCYDVYDDIKYNQRGGNQADDKCANLGGTIVMHLDTEVVKFIQQSNLLTGQGISSYWLNLHKQQWIKITPKWTYWSDGNPTTDDAAIAVVSDNHRWQSIPESTKQRAICQKMVECPNPVFNLSGESICYFMPLGETVSTQDEAIAFCKEYTDGAHLFIPDTEDKWNFFLSLDMYKSLRTTSKLWLYTRDDTWGRTSIKVSSGWSNWYSAKFPGFQKAGIVYKDRGTKWYQAKENDITLENATVICELKGIGYNGYVLEKNITAERCDIFGNSTGYLYKKTGMCYEMDGQTLMPKQIGTGKGAREHCENFGAGLVQLYDREIIDFIQQNYVFYGQMKSTYWIYLRNDKWGGILPTTWTHWNSGGQNSIKTTTVADTDADHQWYGIDQGIPDEHHVICQKLTVCPNPVFDPRGQKICYFMPAGESLLAWNDARKFCERYSAIATIIKLDSQDKTDFLLASSMFKTLSGDAYWVGFKNMSDGYIWESDSSLVSTGWTNWNQSVAPDSSNGHAGISLRSEGNLWESRPESDLAMVICQIPGLPYLWETEMTTLDKLTSTLTETTPNMEIITTKYVDTTVAVEATTTPVSIEATTKDLIECGPFPSWYNIRTNTSRPISLSQIIAYFCVEGYKFPDEKKRKLNKCNKYGVWKHKFQICEEIQAKEADALYKKPVEAKLGPVIGSMAFVFLIVEGICIALLDTTHFKICLNRLKTMLCSCWCKLKKPKVCIVTPCVVIHTYKRSSKEEWYPILIPEANDSINIEECSSDVQPSLTGQNKGKNNFIDSVEMSQHNVYVEDSTNFPNFRHIKPELTSTMLDELEQHIVDQSEFNKNETLRHDTSEVSLLSTSCGSTGPIETPALVHYQPMQENPQLHVIDQPIQKNPILHEQPMQANALLHNQCKQANPLSHDQLKQANALVHDQPMGANLLSDGQPMQENPLFHDQPMQANQLLQSTNLNFSQSAQQETQLQQIPINQAVNVSEMNQERIQSAHSDNLKDQLNSFAPKQQQTLLPQMNTTSISMSQETMISTQLNNQNECINNDPQLGQPETKLLPAMKSEIKPRSRVMAESNLSRFENFSQIGPSLYTSIIEKGCVSESTSPELHASPGDNDSAVRTTSCRPILNEMLDQDKQGKTNEILDIGKEYNPAITRYMFPITANSFQTHAMETNNEASHVLDGNIERLNVSTFSQFSTELEDSGLTNHDNCDFSFDDDNDDDDELSSI